MAGRLRVMRVISRLNVGGPAAQVAVLHKGLDRARFQQLLCAGGLAAGEAAHSDLSGQSLPMQRVPGLGRPIRLGDDARAVASLVAAMRRFQPHIVHTHAAKAGLLGRIAATMCRVPIRVHTFHGHLLHGYFGVLGTRAVVASERVLARATHAVVAVGDQVRQDLLAARIGDPLRYAVVPPGTTLHDIPPREDARTAFGLSADAPVLAYVGRITGVKRPDRLAQVIHRIHAARPDTTFLVCGDGDLMTPLRDSVADLGASVRLLGWTRRIEAVYAASDLALLTSDNEGMPVSLIESALAGVPAVASGVGSVPEVVHDGVTGLLCPPDANAIAAAALELLADPARRARMAHAARQRAEALFSADRLIADMDKLYTELAANLGLLGGRQMDIAAV